MKPHSRRWTPIGNRPKLVGNIVAEQSAQPVWRTSLQCIATSLKNRKVMWLECGVRHTRKRMAHERCTGCTVQLSWMGPRTFIVVSPQSFSPCNVHSILCRSLPVDPADRPATLTHEEQVLFWLEGSATLTTPRPGLGTGSAHHLWPLVAYTTRINL